MANNDWKQRFGVVFSTNPDFEYEEQVTEPEPETLHPSQQRLHVSMERAGRKGKTVTLVKGFVGCDADLQDLSKKLKTKLCVGGTAKNGEIVIQGDLRQRVKELLTSEGYAVKG